MLTSSSPVADLTREQYNEALPDLRLELIEGQRLLQKTQRSLIIIVSGVDGAGKGAVIHRLNEWLDPRGLKTEAFWNLPQEALERPDYWKYWQALPPKGRIGIFFGAWYGELIREMAAGDGDQASYMEALKRILRFERMLAETDVFFVKTWFHLSKKAQHKRLNDLEKNPRLHWRVLDADWKHHELYDNFLAAAEMVLEQTDQPGARWHVIDSSNPLAQDLAVARLVAEQLQACAHSDGPLEPSETDSEKSPTSVQPELPAASNHLQEVEYPDLPRRQKNKSALLVHQRKLNRLTWKGFKKKRGTVLVFEGWDAAGKGGCIRRVTEAIDARLYKIVSTGPPSTEENRYHYFWRFWRSIPRAGQVMFFDRSWYGRVLVERIEGFASPEEWQRAYQEINEFEEQLVEAGIVVIKFWLQITKDEQLQRFQARQEIPYKRYKITDEDWRNRERWAEYETAVNDMISYTHNSQAPWHIIPANDKKYARIQVVSTIAKRLDQTL